MHKEGFFCNIFLYFLKYNPEAIKDGIPQACFCCCQVSYSSQFCSPPLRRQFQSDYMFPIALFIGLGWLGMCNSNTVTICCCFLFFNEIIVIEVRWTDRNVHTQHENKTSFDYNAGKDKKQLKKLIQFNT